MLKNNKFGFAYAALMTLVKNVRDVLFAWLYPDRRSVNVTCR